MIGAQANECLTQVLQANSSNATAHAWTGAQANHLRHLTCLLCACGLEACSLSFVRKRMPAAHERGPPCLAPAALSALVHEGQPAAAAQRLQQAAESLRQGEPHNAEAAFQLVGGLER